MTTQKIEFRTALPEDAPGIAHVLEVFSPAPAASANHEHLLQIRNTAGQWRVGVQAGEIIAAAHAAPSEVWFGRSRFRWADVGEVSVLASRQGEGIGSLLMQDVVQWQRDSGVGMSRLGGLMRFYSRFGYEPFPRMYIEFPVSQVIRAGASRVPFADLLQPALPDAGTVRLFDETRDIPSAFDVLEKFTQQRTGVRAWNRDGSTPADLRGFFVYESDGRVRGLMRFREFEADMSPFEASLMIYQLAYDTDCPAALDALLKHVLKRAHEKQATRATAYLPFTDDVIQDLQHTGVSYTLCENMGAIASNMIQITNLRALLEQLRPELQNRLARGHWKGSITFDLGDQQATLDIDAAHIEVGEASTNSILLTLTHADLCRAILGVLPPIWPRIIDETHDVVYVLDALFPAVRGGYTS